MGYYFVLPRCFICGIDFVFNPDRVPAVLVAGRAQPLCADCIVLTNCRRQVAGLEVIEIPAGSYELAPKEPERHEGRAPA